MRKRFNYGCFAVIGRPAEWTMQKTPEKFRIPEFGEKFMQNVKSSYHSCITSWKLDISREVGSGLSSQLKHVMWPFSLASPRSHDVRRWTARCFNMNCRWSTRNGSDTLWFSQANHIEHGSVLCRNCWNSLCAFRSLSKVKLSSAVEVKVHFSCILRFHDKAKDPFVNVVLTYFLVVEDQDWCSPKKQTNTKKHFTEQLPGPTFRSL